MRQLSHKAFTVAQLAAAVKNAQVESVHTVKIQVFDKSYDLSTAQIIPHRTHSDLVLFAGTPIPTESSKTSFFSGLFGKKEKPIPLNKQLHSAFFNALETVLISNGKNPNSFDFSTFQEIKSSIAQFSEALENYSNAKDFGGVL